MAKIVMSEVYYEKMVDNDILSSLNYMYTIGGMRGRGIIAEDASIIPCRTRIMGVAVQFKNLQTAYGDIGAPLGYDHAYLDKLNDYESYDIGFVTWQYEHVTLCEPFEVAVLDYSKGSVSSSADEGRGVGVINKEGTIHAVMFFVEHVGLQEGSSYSTNSKYCCQRVKFLRSENRKDVKVGGNVSAVFEVSDSSVYSISISQKTK
jgi:hypothetical protein